MNHSFNFSSPITLLHLITLETERDRERERERKRFKSERQYLFLHFATRVVGEEAFATEASRPAPLTSTESYAIAYSLKSNSNNTLHRETKRTKDTLLSNSKSSAILSRSKSYLTISHFRQTNLTRTAGKSGLSPGFLPLLHTTNTSGDPSIDQSRAFLSTHPWIQPIELILNPYSILQATERTLLRPD